MKGTKNHGLIIQPIVIDKHWIFGSATQAPGDILQPNRDWRPFLPEHAEVQNLNGIEPNACTIFGTLNQAQTVIKRMYGEDRDYSNRFLAVISGTDPTRGNNPHTVLEALRHDGDCDEAAWTFDDAVDTLEKFYAPIPEPVKTLAKQFVAEWKLNHDWVPTNPASLWDALQYSPLGLSVYAWEKGDDGLYYKPAGATDTHWVELVYAEWGKYWLIRDSYVDDGVLYKKLHWNMPFSLAKRISIERQTDTQSSGWQWFVQFLQSLWPFPVITPAPSLPVQPPIPPQEAPNTPAPTPPTPAPASSKLEAFCEAIKSFEGWAPGTRSFKNNNPGNCRYSSQGYLKMYEPVLKDAQNFAVFRDYATGWLYLKNLVIAKTQVNPNQSILDFFSAYAPAEDNNDPLTYAKFVAKRCGVPATTKMKDVISAA